MDNLRKAFLVKGNSIVGAVGDKYFSNAPIGVIQAFSGNTAPHGYLLADGTSYKVADYPDLYAVIGNTYGGDTENFNVPTVQPPALTMVYIIKAFHTNEGVDSKNEVSDPIIEYVEGNLSRLSDYSTEEKVIGKWVDGKPVYEKTVFSSFTNYTVGEETTFNIPLDNVNIVISIDGMINYDTIYPVPVNYHYENTNGHIQRIATFYSQGHSSIQTFVYCMKKDYVNANYFVTIRYTKTTD